MVRRANFDLGRRSEAKRLAIGMRILLHHRPSSNSHALLCQIGLRDVWRWLDTAGELDDRNLLTICNLVAMKIVSDGEGNIAASYEPYLGSYPTETAVRDSLRSAWSPRVSRYRVRAGTVSRWTSGGP